MFQQLRRLFYDIRHGYRLAAVERAREANRNEDWTGVIENLEQAHSKGLSMDETRFLLGSAYCMVGRWECAVTELERIGDQLKDPECERQRWYNYLVSLARLERRGDVREALAKIPADFWTDEYAARIRKLSRFATAKRGAARRQ